MPTKGPWRIRDFTDEVTGNGYVSIIGPKGERIADIFPFRSGGGVGMEEARENAALIASVVNSAD